MSIFGGARVTDEEHTRVVTRTSSSDIGAPERVHFIEGVAGPALGGRRLISEFGMTVGRAPPADLILSDSEVSRSHCRLMLEGERLLIADLGSTNGVFVNGGRITEPTPIPVGAVFRIGRSTFQHGCLTDGQLARADALDKDLEDAKAYVQALLPPPLREGPIRADWIFQPCVQLGGDAFGYGPLPGGKYFGYVLDVSGHGAAAALHSVAVMNVLRQGALTGGASLERPAEVLGALNTMFPMERHAEMYLSLWYGVWDPQTRILEYATAGHHPGFLMTERGLPLTPLRTRNGLIGVREAGALYRSDSVALPPGASLYIFSDGLFEIVTIDGVEWDLTSFLPLISEPQIVGASEASRLFRAVRSVARPGDVEDDVTIVVLTFE